jgi:hypothetical protein
VAAAVEDKIIMMIEVQAALAQEVIEHLFQVQQVQLLLVFKDIQFQLEEAEQVEITQA